MRTKTICTTLLIFTSVTLLVVLALRVRVGATADSVAVLRTTGMTCGSCSSTISKALEREKGVAVTEVDVDGGWVIVGYDTKTITPENLALKVRDAGFGSNVYAVLTPEEFKRVTGREIGKNASAARGCCGGKGGGCGTQQKN
ncbi:MAG TPA: heavy-metal-associated domain-containing protein [Geobacteraceae bacterium]